MPEKNTNDRKDPTARITVRMKSIGSGVCSTCFPSMNYLTSPFFILSFSGKTIAYINCM